MRMVSLSCPFPILTTFVLANSFFSTNTCTKEYNIPESFEVEIQHNLVPCNHVHSAQARPPESRILSLLQLACRPWAESKIGACSYKIYIGIQFRHFDEMGSHIGLQSIVYNEISESEIK